MRRTKYTKIQNSYQGEVINRVTFHFVLNGGIVFIYKWHWLTSSVYTTADVFVYVPVRVSLEMNVW